MKAKSPSVGAVGLLLLLAPPHDGVIADFSANSVLQNPNRWPLLELIASEGIGTLQMRTPIGAFYKIYYDSSLR